MVSVKTRTTRRERASEAPGSTTPCLALAVRRLVGPATAAHRRASKHRAWSSRQQQQQHRRRNQWRDFVAVQVQQQGSLCRFSPFPWMISMIGLVLGPTRASCVCVRVFRVHSIHSLCLLQDGSGLAYVCVQEHGRTGWPGGRLAVDARGFSLSVDVVCLRCL